MELVNLRLVECHYGVLVLESFHEKTEIPFHQLEGTQFPSMVLTSTCPQLATGALPL